MGGFEFDDHGAIMADWMPSSSSPGSVFSSILGDDVDSRSDNDPPNGNQSVFSFPRTQENCVSAIANQKDSGRGGLVERMAARAGINAPRLDTESIRPAGLSQSLDVQSPYLTIPPGLSPTTLLESPVFLSNSMAQPSPTTGKFGFLQSDGGQSTTMAEFSVNRNDNFNENLNSASFAFKPFPDSEQPFQFNASNGVTLNSFPQQSFPSIEVSVLSENTFPNHSMDPPRNTLSNQQADYSRPIAPSESDHSPPLDELLEEDADQRNSVDPTIDGAPTEDGYNWRKYGQKQVKGSVFPRSYFKCTHPNCPVKKKVERSQEGHITEIIYKGAHNHTKPPPSRRSVMGSSTALVESGEQVGGMAVNGDVGWRAVHDNLEVASSVVQGLDYSHLTTTSLQAQNGSQLEHGEAADGSSTFSNGENDEDRATQGSVSLGYEGEGDESQSKRRKVETYAADVSGVTRAIREPRVVVQTTSEVDILDDGYRWRKYGQKVVKGNPNPRSYYKCTSPGCSVRKHVERASHDLKSVITTYEGKHNHDVPAARNSSHVNSVLAGNLPSQLVRSEPSQLHNSMGQFERASLGLYGIPGRPPIGGSGLGFGFGMHQPGLTMPGMGPMNPYLAQQNRAMNDMGGLMYPKGEPKSEPMSDLSNGSSVYNQVINRLPLGPQM